MAINGAKRDIEGLGEWWSTAARGSGCSAAGGSGLGSIATTGGSRAGLVGGWGGLGSGLDDAGAGWTWRLGGSLGLDGAEAWWLVGAWWPILGREQKPPGSTFGQLNDCWGIEQSEVCPLICRSWWSGGLAGVATVVSAAARILVVLMCKHEFDARYQKPEDKLYIAQLYFPLIGQILDEMPVFYNLNAVEKREVLIVILQIVRNLDDASLVKAWQKSIARTRLFFKLMEECLSLFEVP
ncbi:uncharacterized protein LOC133800226 [Humulus lupulus]|uniref:uncharacterized protein LOC133800226 n=1 Tax=Humulus lupulus TaxID=3486 RepID=UPI002B4014FD|nr:uncharacterized protein LOC133800226 [Humulus lupulus]